jgi:DNA-binding NarL/FixJ family response regulator
VSEGRIRVLVADDHAVVREGIRTLLEATPDFEVVGEASSGEEALALIAESDPDVAVLDITMPGISGIDVIGRLRATGARAGVLVLSMHDHPEYVLGAVRAGADGYLLKSAGPAEIREAVRAVAAGHEAFGARVMQQLGSALRDEALRSASRSRLDLLTQRELEVLTHVAAGRTSREIGEDLGISHRTVETHRESIMKKLGIRTVAGLTRFALEAGIHR